MCTIEEMTCECIYSGGTKNIEDVIIPFCKTVAMGQIELGREKQGQTTVVYSTMHP
jgi:hypothetical protein